MGKRAMAYCLLDMRWPLHSGSTVAMVTCTLSSQEHQSTFQHSNERTALIRLGEEKKKNNDYLANKILMILIAQQPLTISLPLKDHQEE